MPTATDKPLADLLAWAIAHLDHPLTVTDLARHAHMSSRNLARHFHAATGTTPLQWLHTQRIHRAQELLETTDHSVEHIADKTGMGTAATLRRHFNHALGVPPTRTGAPSTRRTSRGVARSYPAVNHRPSRCRACVARQPPQRGHSDRHKRGMSLRWQIRAPDDSDFPSRRERSTRATPTSTRTGTPDAAAQQVWSWVRHPQHEVDCLLAGNGNGVVAGPAHYRAFARPLTASTGTRRASSDGSPPTTSPSDRQLRPERDTNQLAQLRHATSQPNRP
jgi:AraC-like DNA-binding protein